jgi:hypothetical protein
MTFSIIINKMGHSALGHSAKEQSIVMLSVTQIAVSHYAESRGAKAFASLSKVIKLSELNWVKMQFHT